MVGAGTAEEDTESLVNEDEVGQVILDIANNKTTLRGALHKAYADGHENGYAEGFTDCEETSHP